MKLLLLIMLLISNNLFAKEVSLKNTEVKYIKSKTNGINYRLYISLPSDYKESKNQYPVVYLLDQDYSFAIAHNIFEHLSDRKDLPKAILVAIGYDNQDKIPNYNDKNILSNYKINRTRDYTPIATNLGDGYGAEYDTYTGDGIKFKEFIQQELMPFIEHHYRVENNKTLVGHSYGGLFVMWLYLSDNNMFDNYIAISPSLWYNDNYIFSFFNKNLEFDKNNKLYITVGNDETKRMIDGVKNISKKLKNNNIKSEILHNENHNTIFPIGLIHGLRFIFKSII